MTKTIVLSERKTKAAAALAQMTLEEINKAAGLGVGYISRKWGSDGVTLATINRVAKIIGCSGLDLLEETDQPTKLEPLAKPDPAAGTRQAKRNELLTPLANETLPVPTDEEQARFEAIKRERLAAAQAELARRASGK